MVRPPPVPPVPVQIGEAGLDVQVAISVAQPACEGFAVHWAKVRPVLVQAPGLAAQRAAQPGKVGFAAH